MEFAIEMGFGGIALLLVGSIVIGIVMQLIGDTRFGLEWVLTSVGAFVGALAASEFIVGWRTFAPTWDNVALVPALFGGLLAGVVVDAVVRYGTGGSLIRSGHGI
jgi:hypothetical protein